MTLPAPAAPPPTPPAAPSSAAPTTSVSSSSATSSPAHLKTRLTPPKGWQPVNWAELWRYRELTWFLALRDLKVRYKQTLLGAAWAVIQPVMNTLVFTIFFHGLAGVEGEPGVPYVVSTFCAMLIWQMFETAMTTASNSLVGNERLITKVYFPRLAIPLSSVLTAVVDFAIGFAILLCLLAAYRVPVSWAILTMPLFVLMALALAVGVGLWLSALNVQYRDVRYVLPFITRLWFFATPIVYRADTVPEHWRVIYGLNPMSGVVQGFKWAMLGPAGPPGVMLASSAAIALLLLLGGLFYFRRMEQVFADVV